MGLQRIGRARYHASAVALAAVLALTVAACGGSSSPPTSSSSATSSTAAAAPANTAGSTASESQGQHVFVSAGCGSCHTLAAAHSSGAVGPNLDQLKPSDAAVVSQVTSGGGGMPSFSTKLSPAQIRAVAKFVASATH